MATRFQQHGEFKAYIDGQVIVSEVVGPWNRELVLAWAAEMFEYGKKLSATGPYVGIAVIHGSMLCPPDAFEALRRAISYGSRKLGCKGNILVADASVEGRTLLLPTYEKLYDDAIPHRIFYDFDKARAWAMELLAAG
jgi:hypothetical protein